MNPEEMKRLSEILEIITKASQIYKIEGKKTVNVKSKKRSTSSVATTKPSQKWSPRNNK